LATVAYRRPPATRVLTVRPRTVQRQDRPPCTPLALAQTRCAARVHAHRAKAHLALAVVSFWSLVRPAMCHPCVAAPRPPARRSARRPSPPTRHGPGQARPHLWRRYPCIDLAGPPRPLQLCVLGRQGPPQALSRAGRTAAHRVSWVVASRHEPARPGAAAQVATAALQMRPQVPREVLAGLAGLRSAEWQSQELRQDGGGRPPLATARQAVRARAARPEHPCHAEGLV
jgi:hypothetical protein